MRNLLKPVEIAEEGSLAYRRQALVESALGYYFQNMNVQYDSVPMCAQDDGYARTSSLQPPEAGHEDNVLYSVCSDFINNVVYRAFGVGFMDMPRHCVTRLMLEIPVTDPRTVMKRGGDDGMTDKEAALKLCRESMQPGDVIVGFGKTGHTLMYIGDFLGDGTEYVIHCWGKKIDPQTGIDKIEYPERLKNTHPLGGAIRIDPVDEICFSETGKSTLLLDQKFGACFGLYRVLNDPRYGQVTAEARSRMHYRGICVERFCNKNIYGTVCKGDRLTVTVKIKNNSTEAYKDLLVTETLPTGTVLADSTEKLSRCVDVPAGRSVSLSYDVIVTAEDKVEFTGGRVDNLETRSFTIPVSRSRLTDGQKEKLASLPLEALEGDLSELRFVKKYYKAALGMDVGLPDTLNELLSESFVQTDAEDVPENYGGKLLVLRKNAPVADLLIHEHCSGYSVYVGDNAMDLPENKASHGRVKQYWEQYYEVGDVFILLDRGEIFNATDPTHVRAYIYLGENTVVAADGFHGFRDTVGLAFGTPVTLGLRPGKV